MCARRALRAGRPALLAHSRLAPPPSRPGQAHYIPHASSPARALSLPQPPPVQANHPAPSGQRPAPSAQHPPWPPSLPPRRAAGPAPSRAPRPGAPRRLRAAAARPAPCRGGVTRWMPPPAAALPRPPDPCAVPPAPGGSAAQRSMSSVAQWACRKICHAVLAPWGALERRAPSSVPTRPHRTSSSPLLSHRSYRHRAQPSAHDTSHSACPPCRALRPAACPPWRGPPARPSPSASASGPRGAAP